MFCVCVSDWSGSLNRHSCSGKQNSQRSQDDNRISHVCYSGSTCRSWHPSLLSVSYVVSYFDSTLLSWVVYFGFTRPRGCLLSARLTQMWLRTVTVIKKLRFNLVKVCYPTIFMPYFLDWVPELASGVLVSPLCFIFTALFWDFISAKAGHNSIKIWLLMSFRLHWGYFYLKYNSSAKHFINKKSIFFNLKTDCSDPTFFENHTAKIRSFSLIVRFLSSTN